MAHPEARIAAWSSASTFTQNCPARSICGQAREVSAGQNRTSGGSSETEVNDWQVRPTGPWSPIAVTTVTPEAKRDRTSRKWAAAPASSSSTGTVSPGRSSKSQVWPRNASTTSRLGQASSPPAPDGIWWCVVTPPVSHCGTGSRVPLRSVGLA